MGVLFLNWVKQNILYREWFKWLALISVALYGLKCATGKDFICYWDAARMFAAGARDLYVPGPMTGLTYYYPPCFAMVLSPLTLLPPYWAGYLWFSLKLGLMAWIFKNLGPLLEITGAPAKWAVFFSALAVVRFAIDDFKLGQINLLLCEMIIVALIQVRRGREAWPALLIGMATSFKMYPGIFLSAFLFQKRYRLVLIALVTIVLLNALPWFFYGNVYPELCENFVRALPGQRPESGLANQSLYGMLMRYLGPYTTDNGPYKFVNLFNLRFDAIQRIFIILSLGGVAMVAIVAARARSTLHDWSLNLAPCFTMALLIPTVSRKANFVLLFFPFLVAFQSYFKNEHRWPRGAKFALWSAFALVALSSDGLITRRGSNLLESLSDITVGALVIMGLNWWMFFKGKGRTDYR